MNPESIKKWKEIIHNISRQTFKVETKQEKDTDYEEKQYSINIE
jgi:Txe/YoeB family toxin of Txe-Axe toxin-antitoxin module